MTDQCWNRIGIRGDSSCRELEGHVHCRNCPVYALSAMELLDRDLPAGHLEEWTEHFARPKIVAGEEPQSVVVFRIESEWLALPTAIFQEVSELSPVHTVPHRGSGVLLGLVNVRGELLVCVSLAKVLGIGKGGERGPSGEGRRGQERLLVIGRDRHRMVVPVSEVYGVRRYCRGELKPVPATLMKAATAYTRGILTVDGRTAGLLDDTLLFSSVEKGLG